MEVRLRKWTHLDVDSLVSYANEFDIANNLNDAFPYPYTHDSGSKFISFSQDKTIFAIDLNGEAIGSIGLHPQEMIFRKNAELGYWLAKAFWNQGIMTKAVMLIIDYGFKHLEINRIYARPFGSNTASQRVLEKTGFTLEARLQKTILKNDRYEDELIYSIRKH